MTQVTDINMNTFQSGSERIRIVERFRGRTIVERNRMMETYFGLMPAKLTNYHNHVVQISDIYGHVCSMAASGPDAIVTRIGYSGLLAVPLTGVSKRMAPPV